MAMVQKEVRKRSIFGKIIKWSFILFNILMLVWMIAGMSAVSGQYDAAMSEAERAGTAVGGTLGGMVILFLWCAGGFILGMLTLLTRGQKFLVQEEQ